jgi:uncharacterized protein YdaU (DUF1376 family)
LSDERFFSAQWLPWYHKDFLAATQGWTLLERGTYFMLLGAEWEIGPLPSDPARLSSIIGGTTRELEKVWPVVGPKFVPEADGRLVNKRLEQHRAKQAARSDKARQSALQRWNADVSAIAHKSVSANGHANASANGDASAMLLDLDLNLNTKSKRPERSARAIPSGPRERGSGVRETDPEVQRRRQEAAAIVEHGSSQNVGAAPGRRVDSAPQSAPADPSLREPIPETTHG